MKISDFIPAEVLAHFKTHDPLMYQMAIQMTVPIGPRIKEDLFLDICETIIGQQLSNKVADVLCTRFREYYENKVRPEKVLATPHETLRAMGLSNAKANYILGIAQAVVDKQLDLLTIATLENEAFITELTKLKGIGPWTAEMMLMFSLGRPDVFSTGDLGLKKGIMKIYSLDEVTIEDMLMLSEKWKPYRTYASQILWKSLEL
ncbi:MAG: DNA-3-methyladenine glycosylase [Weeksellaceae bacterium]